MLLHKVKETGKREQTSRSEISAWICRLKANPLPSFGLKVFIRPQICVILLVCIFTYEIRFVESSLAQLFEQVFMRVCLFRVWSHEFVDKFCVVFKLQTSPYEKEVRNYLVFDCEKRTYFFRIEGVACHETATEFFEK